MAAIDLNTLRYTIEGRMKTEFDATPSYHVAFHNTPYVPTPNSTWLQCLVSFGVNSYLTQGGTTGSDNSVRGVMAINIFTPKGDGPGANYTITKRARDLFNRQVVSGIIFDAVNGPEVVATPIPEGFFQTQMRVTFEAFESL